jgi:gamma-glutamyl phosphate reductase
MPPGNSFPSLPDAQAVGPLGADAIALVQTRDEINDLLSLDDVIDLVIPRWGLMFGTLL